jgi:predicted PurR-regulated permease PerM
LYFIVQQLENNVLVPIIMKHAVGLNPVVIIIVMLIGAQFFGLLGVILAIPVATSLAIFVQDYARRPK